MLMHFVFFLLTVEAGQSVVQGRWTVGVVVAAVVSKVPSG